MLRRFPRRRNDSHANSEVFLDSLGGSISSDCIQSSSRGNSYQHHLSEGSEEENVEAGSLNYDITTIPEAISANDEVRLKVLLEAGVPIGDNLLYAVSQGSLNAVKIICAYVQLKEGSETLIRLVNRFPRCSGYLQSATALQLAAKRNDYEIVKVLLRHGAVMPKLEECLEQVGHDYIVRSLAFLLHMRASCSPALLVAKETNPVGKALRLAINLEDNTFINETNGWFVNHKSFIDELKEIRQTLEDFLCTVLDHCKNRSEVDTILEVQANHRFDDDQADSDGLFPKMLNTWEDSVLPPGLEQAISLKFKKYVAHPYAQMILMERAFDGPVRWDKMSSLRFRVLSLFIVLISPFLCLLYAFLPIPKLVRFMQTPYVRILNTSSSHLLFMTFLLLSSLNLKYSAVDGNIPSGIESLTMRNYTGQLVEHQFWSLGSRMIILFVIILGEILWLLYNLYRMGIRMFSRQVWNWINFVQTSIFSVSLISYVIVYIKTMYLINQHYRGEGEDLPIPQFVKTGGHSYESSRTSWDLFDPLLIAELSFAIGNCLTVMRLLYTFMMINFLGPLVIAMSRMFVTLCQFFVISVLLLVSFALGLTQLFAPYQSLPSCDDPEMDDGSFCGKADMFKSFKASILTLFWAIFGDFAIIQLRLPANLQMITNSGHVMHAIFVILMTIAVLNMLIGSIINVYDSVQGNIDMEWKFARTKMLEEHLGKRANLPPPYNLLPSVNFIKQIVCSTYHWMNKKLRRMRTKLLASGSSTPYNWPRHRHRTNQDEDDDGDIKRIYFKGRHQVLKSVVSRYADSEFPAANHCSVEREDGMDRLSVTSLAARRSSTIYKEHAYSRQSSIRRNKFGSTKSDDSQNSYRFKPISEDAELPKSMNGPPILEVPEERPPLIRLKSNSVAAMNFDSISARDDFQKSDGPLVLQVPKARPPLIRLRSNSLVALNFNTISGEDLQKSEGPLVLEVPDAHQPLIRLRSNSVEILGAPPVKKRSCSVTLV